MHMYPNGHQKRLLKKWMGVSRFVYNAVIDFNRKRVKYEKDSEMGPAFRTWVRYDTDKKEKTRRWDGLSEDATVNKFWFGEEKFCRRMVALKSALRGFSLAEAKNISDESITEALETKAQVISVNMDRNIGNRPSFSGFRSRKNVKQTIRLRSQNFGKGENWDKFYIRYMHSRYSRDWYATASRLKPMDGHLFPCHLETKRRNNDWPHPHEITSDCKLTYKRLTNDWIFSWSYTKDVKHHENQVDEKEYLDVVSIDPGVRTPFTWYSPTKGVGKIGDADKSRLIRICMYLDNLVSQISKMATSSSKRKKKQAQRMRHAAARTRLKLKHLQKEIHRKSVHFFVHNFDVIVLPAFGSPAMSRRLNRKISSKTTRSMLGWAHGDFRSRLVSKAEEFAKTVIIQDEAYTSKTCSWCGNLQNVKHIYKCKSCGVKMDRDENGARGILIRAMQRNALIFKEERKALVPRN